MTQIQPVRGNVSSTISRSKGQRSNTHWSFSLLFFLYTLLSRVTGNIFSLCDATVMIYILFWQIFQVISVLETFPKKTSIVLANRSTAAQGETRARRDTNGQTSQTANHKFKVKLWTSRRRMCFMSFLCNRFKDSLNLVFVFVIPRSWSPVAPVITTTSLHGPIITVMS